VAQSVRLVDYLTTHISLSPIRRGLSPGFVNYKKGALNSQPQVIKFTSYLSMVSGSLRVLCVSNQIYRRIAYHYCTWSNHCKKCLAPLSAIFQLYHGDQF
jgi:hypothetical protein